MKRARAQALVLVNWRGVFYERYQIDRHVTALEGDNGAGKTTVMIAAYIVLLPDMSRIRFTNIGETGATGGDRGIWGRLGDIGRPSYSAIEFALATGRRIVAGVHLERKGEPSVEPTPFLITGLAPETGLQEVLLLAQGNTESVPELSELRENATRLGGHFKAYTTARDYFAVLFDHGITPLRLGNDEERNKLNEMLKTSMTGGISHVLTSDLRSFLLKEEAGLAGTLQRMKANLSACHRTRTEVRESQQLQQEIESVFEAGHRMFRASFLSAKVEAREAEARVAQAESVRAEARADLDAVTRNLESLKDELGTKSRRESELNANLDRAESSLRRLEEALEAAEDLARYSEALDEASEREQIAAREKTRSERARERRRNLLRKARERYNEASEGVSKIHKGLELLHTRAAAYKRVLRRKSEAERLLGGEPLDAECLGTKMQHCRDELAHVDQARRDAVAHLSDADELQRRHRVALDAVSLMAADSVPAESAYGVARQQLRRYRDLEVLANRAEWTGTELAEVRKLAKKQLAVRARIVELGVEPGNEPAGERIRAALERLEADHSLLVEKDGSLRVTIERLERFLEDAAQNKEDLATREPLWNDLETRARRLEAVVSHPVRGRKDLDRARAAIAQRLEHDRSREERLNHDQERIRSMARELLAAGGFSPDLLRLRDELGGELLASSFDDVGIEDAAVTEALLGPLIQAIVVEDTREAARAVQSRSAALPDVWLAARNEFPGDLAVVASDYCADTPDIAVPEGHVLRVSRIPDKPRLGLKAREKRAAELRQEADDVAKELDEVRVRRRSLDRLSADGEELLAGHAAWLEGDPREEILAVRERVAKARAQLHAYHSDLARVRADASGLRPRHEDLRAVLGDALIADPPDYMSRVKALESDFSQAVAAQAEVKRCADAASDLDGTLDVLRFQSVADADLDTLRRQVEERRQERGRLADAIEAIEYVSENAHALAWTDAPELVERDFKLVPSLTRQRDQAQRELESAEHAERDAEMDLDAANRCWQDADRCRLLALERREHAKARLARTEIENPTSKAVDAELSKIDRLKAEKSELETALGDLRMKLGRCQRDSENASRHLEAAEVELEARRSAAKPVVESWSQLSETVAQHGLLSSVLSSDEDDVGNGASAPCLRSEADRCRGTLEGLLTPAQGASGLLDDKGGNGERTSLGFAWSCFEVWIRVRDWLRRRLPAQIAEVDDPHEGLLRLRDQLKNLEARLKRQESDLRGSSEDIQRGIEVQIRKARGQVKRLNRDLTKVGFGSIEQIRVVLENDESMDQVFRALREREVQRMLFSEELPLEEALERIFSRWGRGKSGGQRVLDYREYVKLQVEVRRKSGKGWEIAKPTRLSTGEAIGVGAALMMVVLTSWERDANLLRRKRDHGSLRFLFLDEANRLSHDNLGVLFDLCEALDLQLMIASPEVARAHGNTTYHLVRTAKDGREEVLVSGRRTVAIG